MPHGPSEVFYKYLNLNTDHKFEMFTLADNKNIKIVLLVSTSIN